MPCRWLRTCGRSGDPWQRRVTAFALQWKCLLLLNVLVTSQNVHIHPLDDEFHVCPMAHGKALWLRASGSHWDRGPNVGGLCRAPVSSPAQPGQTHTLPPVAGVSCEPAWGRGPPYFGACP